MRKITINTDNDYDIYIGRNNFNLIEEKTANKNVAIITDENVLELYGTEIENVVKNKSLKVNTIIIKAGEKQKNAETVFEVLEKLAELGMTRSDVIVGGGVVGDVAGFCASIYLRGIKVVQVPTTLLAMVDSSVGGKTGFNLSSGKNLVGTFHQPSLVVCNLETIKTLTKKEFNVGIAEVIKYGVIKESEMFQQLFCGNVENSVEDIVEKCIKSKKYFVEQDEKDCGVRQILNFGHTIGHAIEKLSDYSVSHGEAVSIGMVMISKSAFKNNISKIDCSIEIIKILEQFQLPTKIEFSAKELAEVILSDKKINGGSINLVVPIEIGKCELLKIPVENIEEFIR